MIVFAAIVPHSPLLVPALGTEHRGKLAATLAAIENIEQALYLAKPDSLCIIAPHDTHYADAFSLNLGEQYVGTLKAFGNFSTTIEAKSDHLLIDRIQRKLRNEGIPLTLSSKEELDYGFTVPLLLLTPHLEQWKLIPISPSALDGQSHYQFGQELKRVLHAESERVAIIASADLSHRVNEASPGGATTEGQLFDETVRQSLETNDVKRLLSLDPAVEKRAEQCAFRPITTLLGAVSEMNAHPKLLSYEAPFGVGYVTVKYEFA